MTEIELHQGNVLSPREQWQYAETVAQASMLPTAYRNKPADIMLAVGLGQAMGLSPAEALWRIDVIQGKPTASAELIAANVRKAGHKLRLTVDEQNVIAQCTIIRADDPDYAHTVVRDRAWAQQMGLLGKDNYKKQPGTMLGWRAVTACARMACPEALYGVTYTPDEMSDFGGAIGSGQAEMPPATSVRSILDPSPQPSPAQDPVGPESEDVQADEPSAGEPMFDYRSAWARGTFFPALRAAEENGLVTDAKDFMSEVAGRDITSSKDLTEAEAQMIVDNLPAPVEAAEENGANA